MKLRNWAERGVDFLPRKTPENVKINFRINPDRENI
jgi:hypothetical protein